MRGLLGIVLLFRKQINKFNNTESRMLNSTKTTLKSCFCMKTLEILPYTDVIKVTKICLPLVPYGY